MRRSSSSDNDDNFDHIAVVVVDDDDDHIAVVVVDDDDDDGVVKPLWEVVRFSGTGSKRLKHYKAFEFRNDITRVFEIGMTVLVTPELVEEKPYIALIKDIVEDSKGSLSVVGQWFYRPEEAKKERGGYWEENVSNEIFYSFHVDEVPAKSLMDECVIHFVPLHKKIPCSDKHPGMIVQMVYDTENKKLLNLKESVFGEAEQHEIDQLVLKTVERVGELPDLVTECSSQKGAYSNNKKTLHKKKANPLSLVDSTTRFEELVKAYSPRSAGGLFEVSEYHAILSKFNVLTGDAYRDKWLENLLCRTKYASSSKEVTPMEDVSDFSQNVNFDIRWPEDAIPIVTKLESVTYETDRQFRKYNRKMRHLDYNLKANPRLTRRLLKKELDPATLLTMTPEELKQALTAEERSSMKAMEPEKELIRMTGNKCQICNEMKVGIADIIHAGRKGDCYQLRCVQCGKEWSCFRDAVIFDS